jgi:hypothetical protein
MLNAANTEEIKPVLAVETALCDHAYMYSSANIDLSTFVGILLNTRMASTERNHICFV